MFACVKMYTLIVKLLYLMDVLYRRPTYPNAISSHDCKLLLCVNKASQHRTCHFMNKTSRNTLIWLLTQNFQAHFKGFFFAIQSSFFFGKDNT